MTAMTWKTTLVLALGAGACGGAGVTGSSPPQAILSATFQQGADNSCTLAGQGISLGIFPDGGTANPTPVPSGQTNNLGKIGITCKVDPTGIDTYTVDGAITAGANSIFVIHGDMTVTAPADGGIPKIMATLANNASPNVSYAQTDGGCNVIYQTTTEGVTGGRVWGVVTCPAAAGINGAAGTCKTVSEFRFENCEL